MKYAKALPLLLLLTACVKEIEPVLNNNNHPITIVARSEATEADYNHALLLFKGNAQGADSVSIETTQASNAAALFPFLLANGSYTVAALAFSSDNNITFSPTLATGSPLSTHLTIGNGTVPDILFNTKPFVVSQTATIDIELRRIVGRVNITLSNVPTNPAIQSIQLTISGLSDRFALNNGIYSASNGAPQGLQRSIPLTLKEGTTDTYTDAGTILMPSLPGITTLPLVLYITYADNTVQSKAFSIQGKISAGLTSVIQLNYIQPPIIPTLQTLAISYAPWQTDSYSADVEINPSDPSDPPTIPSDNIGTLAQGGIICAPNLILSLTESSTPLQWGNLTIPSTIPANSIDGAINYDNFAAYADQNPNTRWDRHPAFEYIRGIRQIDAAPWYIPSKEEWKTIVDNLIYLNVVLAANSSTTINGTAKYWTSVEENAVNAYCITPSTKSVESIPKALPSRVRAVKKIND